MSKATRGNESIELVALELLNETLPQEMHDRKLNYTENVARRTIHTRT